MEQEQNTTAQTEQIGQQQILHETTLFAEPIYQNKNFTITNALLTSWVAVAIIIVLAAILRSKLRGETPENTPGI